MRAVLYHFSSVSMFTAVHKSSVITVFYYLDNEIVCDSIHTVLKKILVSGQFVPKAQILAHC